MCSVTKNLGIVFAFQFFAAQVIGSEISLHLRKNILLRALHYEFTDCYHEFRDGCRSTLDRAA